MCEYRIKDDPTSARWVHGESWRNEPSMTTEPSTSSIKKCSSLRIWLILGTLFAFMFVFDSIIVQQSGVLAERIERKNDEKKGFIVNNEGCKLADLDPFDEFSKSYMTVEKPISCEFGSESPLVESNNTFVFINEDAFDQYYNKTETARCCWRSFDRKNNDDNKLKFDENCHEFTTSSKVTAEFVKVECFRGKKRIYRDYHFFVPPKKRIENIIRDSRTYETEPKSDTESRTAESKRRKLSVLMVGLDGVSRMHVHREMPKMASTLKQLGAVEMMGYTKIGENTYPSFVSTLTGLTSSELEESNCRNTSKKHFDNCPFLWKNFSESGYRTIFAEDACFMATFNYDGLPGFYNQPTDYYWRPYCVAAENDIGNTNNVKLCVGTRLTYQNLLNYTRKVAREFANEPYFGFFWQASLTHDYWNLAQLGDETYAEAFDSFYQNGWLENTALIVMSDHGMRQDKFRFTYPGKVEASLPFMYIVLPEWWKKEYPTAWLNLQENGERLMTPFDLHNSILDLLEPESISEKSIRERTQSMAVTKEEELPRGISLFLPIPDSRTCDMAGIPSVYCMCHKKSDVSVEDLAVKNASYYLIGQLNDIFDNNHQGAKLKLKRILTAQSWNQGDTEYGPFPWSDFEITIETTPNSTIFEASIRSTTKGNNTLVGSIRRWDITNDKHILHEPILVRKFGDAGNDA